MVLLYNLEWRAAFNNQSTRQMMLDLSIDFVALDTNIQRQDKCKYIDMSIGLNADLGLSFQDKQMNLEISSKIFQKTFV